LHFITQKALISAHQQLKNKNIPLAKECTLTFFVNISSDDGTKQYFGVLHGSGAQERLISIPESQVPEWKIDRRQPPPA